MEAILISIGDEILIGQTVDTNSNLIAGRLNEIGIITKEIRAISDESEEILRTIESGFEKCNLIIMTGGLGPTSDDKTKNVLCDFFQTKLVVDMNVLEKIKKFLSKRNININKNNYEQALVPESATVLENNYGTAPGLILEREDKILIALPGVPHEMAELLNTSITDYLKTKVEDNNIDHHYVLIGGIPEAILAEKLAKWEKELPEFYKLAYLPSKGVIRLRLSTNSLPEKVKAHEIPEAVLLQLEEIIPDNIIAYTGDSLQEALGKKLKTNGLRIATAESCTGGKIASLLTSVPGSSAYFMGSVVAYSNFAKTKIPGVKMETIEEYGAVSSQVVEDMADGARKLFATDIAISTSGIAGPDGGSEAKPVGTVWIGVSTKKKTFSKKFVITSDRNTNIEYFSNIALLLAYKSADL